MDYPNIRQSARCPLCERAKDQGLLVCWPCYRVHDMRNGADPLLLKVLNKTEEGVIALGIQA
jgi:hypothetical protein